VKGVRAAYAAAAAGARLPRPSPTNAVRAVEAAPWLR
jgi:hypothetical protein